MFGLVVLPGAIKAQQNGSNSHRITFCGEPIPINDDFVANKLMDVIKAQMPYVNFYAVRQRSLKYFNAVSQYLKKYGIPDDFKYLPVIESGYDNVVSPAGARGFWQLMPATARDFNLVVTSDMDERDNAAKATTVACKLILQYYQSIQSRIHTSSWVLTAAAYNFGVGNVMKAVEVQGTNYFTMQLNPETAMYVYKIIAVKELFENPELYMHNFGTNIFRDNAAAAAPPASTPATAAQGQAATAEFSAMNLKVGSPAATANAAPPKVVKYAYISAHLVKADRDFEDGTAVAIELDENLNVPSAFIHKGNTIKGDGWLIDDRVYVDLGYGHEIQIFDGDGRKGIALAEIKRGKATVMLKTETDDE